MKKPLVLLGLGLILGLIIWFALTAYGNSRDREGYERAEKDQKAESARILAETIYDYNTLVSQIEVAKIKAQENAKKSSADASNARASERRLLAHISTMVADAKDKNPGLTDGGPTAGTTLDMLAYMLGRLSSAARQLAEYGDRARDAGLACQSVYDTVRESSVDK